MNIEQYRIQPKEKVDLSKRATRRPDDADKKDITEKLMPENIQKMADLQERLYAENRYALLICLQAMDAAGKDGAIKHVMTGLNPQGTQVVAFKQPSSEEMDHDYLWRIGRALPRRGEVGIFNRSHYEEVIVAKVHNLVANQQLPPELVDADIWQERYRQINDFERYLHENGIRTVKIYLHLSKDEQRDRLLDRINEPEKNWKFSSGDVRERKHWDEYMKAYEEMMEETSTKEAPWYAVPADNKWYARYVISEIVRQQLEAIDPQFPELAQSERDVLEECRVLLENGN